jgi:hypothetical protein
MLARTFPDLAENSIWRSAYAVLFYPAAVSGCDDVSRAVFRVLGSDESELSGAAEGDDRSRGYTFDAARGGFAQGQGGQAVAVDRADFGTASDF